MDVINCSVIGVMCDFGGLGERYKNVVNVQVKEDIFGRKYFVQDFDSKCVVLELGFNQKDD